MFCAQTQLGPKERPMVKLSSYNTPAVRARTGLRRRGVAMALAVCAILILFTAGAALLHLSLEGKMRAIRTVRSIEARCAADAGLAEAIWAMNEQVEIVPWDDSTLPSAVAKAQPNASGTYSYTITGDESSGYTVESVGDSGVAAKTVFCILGVESILFEYPLFSYGDLDIKNNAEIDGYDSRLGAYGGANQGSTTIGTSGTDNGSIDIGNNAEITGDVIVGTGGNPAQVISGDEDGITGDTYAASEEKELPSITAPVLNYQGGQPSGTISQDGKYDQIDITNGEVLSIVGDVVLHITGDVELNNNASIEITPGSSLVLYLDGNFESSNNGTINNLTMNPPQCKIYGTGTEAVDYEWDNNSVFYGAVYAPMADIVVKNSTDIYGALVGASVTLYQQSTLHCDEAVKEASLDDPGIKFVQARWRE